MKVYVLKYLIMGLFFNANKYIKNVERPRVDRNLPRREQILKYIDKYFDAYNHDYLENVKTACEKYINDMFEEQDTSAKSGIDPEIQAITTMIKGLQGFVTGGELDSLNYMRLLGAREAFTLYCALISRSMDLGIIDLKQAKRRITKFYKDCKLD